MDRRLATEVVIPDISPKGDIVNAGGEILSLFLNKNNNKMKVILCKTPEGQFQIPLQKVAEHRADYYAGVGEYTKGSIEWQDQVDWVMKDDYEGIDWLLNNTDWDEWTEFAVMINPDVRVLKEDFWTSSDDFKIVGI